MNTKLMTALTIAALATTGLTSASFAQTTTVTTSTTTAAATSAATSATAIADLNIRSGPGPQYESIGFVASGSSTMVDGCLEASKWCRVSYEGVTGWSYSDYLTADFSGEAVVLTKRYPDVGLATVTYDESEGAAGGAVAGAAGGAIIGALVGGPIGAAIGGVAGATSGATAGTVIDPPEATRTYVTANRLDPVYLDGEVVIGAGVPENVTLQAIPDYEYQYVYINGQAVLVDPATRQIVYVVR